MKLNEFRIPAGKKIFKNTKNNFMYIFIVRSCYVEPNSKNDLVYGVYDTLEKAYSVTYNGFEGWMYIEVWDAGKGEKLEILEFEDIRKAFKYFKQQHYASQSINLPG